MGCHLHMRTKHMRLASRYQTTHISCQACAFVEPCRCDRIGCPGKGASQPVNSGKALLRALWGYCISHLFSGFVQEVCTPHPVNRGVANERP